MNRTFKERVAARFARLVKKYKWTLPFCYVAMAVVFACYDTGCHFGNNCKRYISILAVAVIFVSTSSFASPTLLTHGEENSLAQNMDAMPDPGESDIAFAAEHENTSSENQEQNGEIPEDENEPDGYDNEVLERVDLADTYSLEDILAEGNTYTAAVSSPEQEEQPVFNKNDWNLLLVNKQHPIPEGYTFTLGKITGNMQCDERIIPELLAMLQAAKTDGVNLVICSPYRDLNRQEMLFNRKIDAYMGKGMCYMEAYKTASQAVTVPGASEHQIGLAIDIVCDSYYSLNEGFGDTPAGKWLAEHSCEYGFILRYPLGKEYITSIEYEPWHFRYVGKEAATEITEKGITLEEFIEGL